MNTRRPHVKNGIRYVHGGKQNAREVKNGQEFSKFTKEGAYQKKQAKSKVTNDLSKSYDYHTNASHNMSMLFQIFDASYVLMKNKHSKIIANYVGPRNKNSKTCVWVPKTLVADVK